MLEISQKIGTLPIQYIRKFVEAKFILTKKTIPENNFQPASLDLRVGTSGTVAYRVPGICLPQDERVETLASKLSSKSNFYPIDIGKSGGLILEVGVPYIIPLMEELALPESISGKANNKSSSGRINLQVRTLCDFHPEFDTIPAGYKGPLYILVVAQSFPVHISPEETLNQIRFFSGDPCDSKLSKDELQAEHEQRGLVFDKNGKKVEWKDIRMVDGGIVLTANLKPSKDGSPVAYRFKGTATHILRYNERNCEPSDYFEPIFGTDDYLVLSKGGFYILSTIEYFSLSPDYCAEMVAYRSEIGEYRSHFAGFFDPGWGFNNGLKGAPAVLEIQPYENILIKHGQPVCVMDLYKMIEKPELIYGDTNNNYLFQEGPRLSKHF